MDSHWAQGAWAKTCGIQIPVVSDFSKEIARSYAVLHPGGMTQRAIVIIDKKGKITCRKVEEDIGQAPDLEQIFAELKKTLQVERLLGGLGVAFPGERNHERHHPPRAGRPSRADG